MSSKIWFTADTHFGHNFINICCKRPYRYADADNFLIENWNSVVDVGDTVYHLGDFAFGNHEKVERYRHQLNGKIHLILGNHDYKNKIYNMPETFSEITPLRELKYNGVRATLCHYAMRVWNASHFDSWQLYGHSHGGLDPVGKQLDVGVDKHDYKPISLEEVIAYMETRPHNFNYIPEEARRGGKKS